MECNPKKLTIEKVLERIKEVPELLGEYCRLLQSGDVRVAAVVPVKNSYVAYLEAVKDGRYLTSKSISRSIVEGI